MSVLCSYFFFFNDTATTEIYTLSLHDALPIYPEWQAGRVAKWGEARTRPTSRSNERSEEHTSELQSLTNLVCRLLLEKKKKTFNSQIHRLHKQHVPPPRAIGPNCILQQLHPHG